MVNERQAEGEGGFLGRFIKIEGHTPFLSFSHSFLLSSWNLGVIGGAPVAVVGHEECEDDRQRDRRIPATGAAAQPWSCQRLYVREETPCA